MTSRLLNASNVFRKLLLNPDFEKELHEKPARCTYSSNSKPFSFETVFYRTPYSYCCCPCAYQHEYFDYISDKDETEPQVERKIDETVFEQIVQNIADGRCPHVKTVEQKYVTTSTVYTDHILAVSGSKDQSSHWGFKDCSSIFQLHILVYLVLKNGCQILKIRKDSDFWSSMHKWNAKFMYPIRSDDNHKIVNFEKLSVFECCARKNNIKVFQYILRSLRLHNWTCSYVSMVYDIALKYEQKEIIDSWIRKGFKTYAHRKGLNTGNAFYRRNCEKHERLISAEAAIVYNNPVILDHVLPKIVRNTSYKEKDKLLFLCSTLQRDECREVFLKYGFEDHKTLTDRHEQYELFHILLSYPSHSDEIIPILQKYQLIWPPFIGPPSMCMLFGNDYSSIHINCLGSEGCCRQVTSVEFIHLLTLGENIDLTRLQVKDLDDIYRDLVELCLYSNLSNLNYLAEQTVYMFLKQYHKTDLKRDGIYFGIDFFNKVRHVVSKVGGKYNMDVNEHFLFGEKNFALNFILPLFIECGFPLSRDLIDMVLYYENIEEEKLHPAAKEYLIQSLEQPRSLQLCCRDSLRRHFKNRQIHSYMSVTNVPNKIKDFILLKTVLPTLKNTDLKLDNDWGKLAAQGTPTKSNCEPTGLMKYFGTLKKLLQK